MAGGSTRCPARHRDDRRPARRRRPPPGVLGGARRGSVLARRPHGLRERAERNLPSRRPDARVVAPGARRDRREVLRQGHRSREGAGRERPGGGCTPDAVHRAVNGFRRRAPASACGEDRVNGARRAAGTVRPSNERRRNDWGSVMSVGNGGRRVVRGKGAVVLAAIAAGAVFALPAAAGQIAGPPTADLGVVSIKANKASAAHGTRVTFTEVIRNNGPETAELDTVPQITGGVLVAEVCDLG